MEPADEQRRALGPGDYVIAGAVAALALVLRLMFLFTWPDHAWPHSLWYEGDAVLWDQWAAVLAGGGVFEHGLALHAPAAAYLLHWLGFGGAQDYTWAKVAWCGVSALGCGLTCLIASAELGRRVGVIAGVLVTISFASYVQAVSLNVEALYTPLAVGAVGLTLRLSRNPGWGTAVLLGLVHGAATLTRPEHPLLAAFLLVPLAVRWRAHSLRDPQAVLARAGVIAITAGVALAACLPWMLAGRAAAVRMNTIADRPTVYEHTRVTWAASGRAYIESMPAFARADTAEYLSHLAASDGGGEVGGERGRAMLLREFGREPEPLPTGLKVSSQGPLVFALANHPAATGGFSKAALDARFGPDPGLNLAMPTHNHLFIHGYAAGWEWIRADPAAWLRLAARKLAILAEGVTQGAGAWNWPLGRQGVRRAVDQFTADGSRAATVWRLVLGALLVTGAGASWRRRACGAWLMVILAKLAVCILFIGYARQAASVLPALAVFLALGVDAAWRVCAVRRPAGWAGPLIAAVLLVAAAITDAVSLARPQIPSLDGPVRFEQRWGSEAYLSPADLRLSFGPAP